MKGVSRTGVMASVISALLLTGCSEAMVDGEAAQQRQDLIAQPAAGQQEVSLVSSIKVGLPAGAYMLAESGEQVTVYLDGQVVEGQVVVSELNNTVTFQPKSQLAPNAQYHVELGSWVSADGDINEQSTWQFNTVAELGATSQWVIDSCMTSEDKALLAELNRLRAQGGNCGDKAYAPVESVSWHCDLAYVAAEHAADQARMGLVGATGSNGMGPIGRVSSADIIWRGVAENDLVAANGQSSIAASKQSPSQCANLLTPELTHVGMASAPTADGLDQVVWTHLFVQM